MHLLIRIVLLAISLVHLSASGSETSPEILTLNNQTITQTTPYIKILHDSNNRYTPEELDTPALAEKFQPISSDIEEGGPDSRYWIKLEVISAEPVNTLSEWVLYLNQRPRFHSIYFYESQPDGNYRKVITGRDYNFFTRDIYSTAFAFRFNLEPGEMKTLYLKLLPADFSAGLPLNLEPEQQFLQRDRANWMGIAGYYAVLLVMLILAAKLFFHSRSDDSVYYLLFTLLFAQAMSSIDGSLDWLIALGFPNILFVPGEMYIVIAMAAQILLFTSLLEIKTRNPTASRLQLPVYLLAAICSVMLAVLGNSGLMLILFSLTVIICWLYLTILSIIAMRRRLTGATYLVIALALLATGSVISALSNYAIIVTDTPLIQSADKLASVIHLLLLLQVLQLKTTTADQLKQQQALELLATETEARVKQKHARFDPLTGLYNRQIAFDIGNQILEESKRYKTPCSVVIVSIDNFKKINTAFGHKLGDDTICHVAQLCHNMIRASDALGRLGADEMVMILPNTDKEGARILADRIRTEAEKLGASKDYSNIQMTVSVGISQLNENDLSVEALVNRADQALFIAANYGRNRVEVA